jgi:hypothetical protein
LGSWEAKASTSNSKPSSCDEIGVMNNSHRGLC